MTSPQHKHWPAHFSDRQASTDHDIVSLTGPAGPPSLMSASRLKITVARSNSNHAYIFCANILRAGAHRSRPRATHI